MASTHEDDLTVPNLGGVAGILTKVRFTKPHGSSRCPLQDHFLVMPDLRPPNRCKKLHALFRASSSASGNAQFAAFRVCFSSCITECL